MILYEEESYKIRGAMFNVYKELGHGHKEAVYQKSFHIALLKGGFMIEKEKHFLKSRK